METTPDTSNYMIMGYIVFMLIMVAYLFSLYQRWRSLEREFPTLSPPSKSGGPITDAMPHFSDDMIEKPLTLITTAYIFNRYKRWCNLERELNILEGTLIR